MQDVFFFFHCSLSCVDDPKSLAVSKIKFQLDVCVTCAEKGSLLHTI